MNYPVTTWTQLPDDPAQARRAQQILNEAARSDGVDPFSEQFVLGITDARLGHRHLLALIDGHLAGVAAVNGDDVEVVVAPARRQAGVGAQLVAAVQEDNPSAGFWAHGNLPAARALAAGREMSVRRRLLVMAVGGDRLDAVEPALPEGYVVRDLADSADAYGRGYAEKAWLEVNNDAFSWHPEQGGWDMSRLHRAQEASWYSDEDVLLLWAEGSAGAAAAQPELAGFHWTKWQPGEDGAADHRQGEVYVVGLASAFRGRGLGSPVVEMGLAHLADGGAREVILYVEDDNVAAVRRYEKLGFQVVEEHVVYS